MLLFADDVVLIATSIDKLRNIFLHFKEFCCLKQLTINADKTKLLVAGVADDKFKPKSMVQFDTFSFECVAKFKYLGLIFDKGANSKPMIDGVLDKANRAMYWLLRFVQNH